MTDIPVQITFRNLSRSAAVVDRVVERVEHLSKFCRNIMNCRVRIELSSKRHHQGNHFHVCIDLKVPGGEIVVGRNPTNDGSHQDVYVAVRDAFDAAERQLEDFVRRYKVQLHLDRRGTPQREVGRRGSVA